MDMVPVPGGRTVAPPRNLMREERRCAARSDCIGEPATLFLRGKAHAARVLNISVQGALLETEGRPDLDDHVVVAFAGCTPVHAAVRWLRDGRVGLHFGRELVLA